MRRRETRNLEYKSDMTDTFLKTVSAYANYGEGVIIFGINDRGEVVGIEDPVSKVLEIENKINDNIEPIPNFNLEIGNSDNTIKLIVFEGFWKPYLYKNKAYKRSDSSTVKVDRIELNRLILEGKNQSYESLKSDFAELTFQVLENKLKQELRISTFNIDVLKTLNLYADRLGYNIAAELLADENSYLGIDIVRFGDNIDEFLDRETLENISLLQQFDMAMSMFKKYYSSELIIGTKRQRKFIIPETAFREVLANAIVHRTWDVKTAIRVSMYKDRIEVVSPGGLPAGLSKEEYLAGHISIFRNPILGNVFFRLNYIEMFGTGIRRINHAYADNIVKPEFNIFENSIGVVLPVINNNLGWLNKDEQILYNALSVGRFYSRADIEEKTGYNKDKLIRTLNQLIEKNIIGRSGKGRGTQYKKL